MKLSHNQERGRAAEHIVIADLILQGCPAIHVGGGWPYDVLAVVQGVSVRIQVKATDKARSWRQATNVYRFQLRSGKRGDRGLDGESVDAVAFVALDIRRVAYFAKRDLVARSGQLKQTVDLRDGATYRGRRYSNGRVRKLDWHQTFDGHHDLSTSLMPMP